MTRPVPPSRGWLRPSAVMAWVVGAVLLMGADCGVDREAGSDAAQSASDRMDAGGDDVGNDCQTARSASACRTRSRCLWLSATCEDGRVVSGCFSAANQSRLSVSCGMDAGGSDAAADAGSDVGARCGRFDQPETCDAQPDCWWWAPTCPGHERSAGCLAEGSIPGDAGACGDVGGSADTGVPERDAGLADAGGDIAGRADAATTGCGAAGDEAACRTIDDCKWWSAKCHDTVVQEACVPQDVYPTPPKCKTTRPLNCYKTQSKAQCGGPHCQWISAGCGHPSVGTLKIEGCMPTLACQSDGDCPTGHGCAKVWIRPCTGSQCTQCGAAERLCVPVGLLKP